MYCTRIKFRYNVRSDWLKHAEIFPATTKFSSLSARTSRVPSRVLRRPKPCGDNKTSKEASPVICFGDINSSQKIRLSVVHSNNTTQEQFVSIKQPFFQMNIVMSVTSRFS